MEPLLAYFGHHKCGTTFITSFTARLCERLGLVKFHSHAEHVFGGNIQEYRARNPFDFWICTNADYEQVRLVDIRGFHLIRDPRDLIVSAYFSHMHSHDDSVWPRLRAFRPYLRSLSKSDGLIAEMRFCAPFLMEMLHWNYRDSRILELRFEEMVAAPDAMLVRACDHLGLLEKASEAVVREIAAELSFARLSGGRAPGEEDLGHHYRKGVPGDWRNHFEERHMAEFQRLYGALLIDTGYEADAKWSQPARGLKVFSFRRGDRVR